MNDNPYLAYAEKIAPKRRAAGPRVIKSEREAPMVLRDAEQKAAETSAQFRRYRRYKATEYREALAGRHGELVKHLHDVLRKLTLQDPEPLLAMLHILRATNPETRRLALAMIGEKIASLREANGLAPFDDSLPILGEEPTVFDICKGCLI